MFSSDTIGILFLFRYQIKKNHNAGFLRKKLYFYNHYFIHYGDRFEVFAADDQ